MAEFGYRYYRVIVRDRALAELFRTGADIHQEALRISLLIKTMATREAPRSGLKEPWGGHPGSAHLSTQHERRGVLGTKASLHRQYPIINKAPYARYVHEGTNIVFAHNAVVGLRADAAELDFRGGGRGTIVNLGPYVRGQDANPWLDRAGQRAARSRFITKPGRVRGGR